MPSQHRGPDTGPLAPTELEAYFLLMEVGNLLHHAVQEQLRAEADLSYVQFEILARLHDLPDGVLRMTDLADGVVYSRSGLTYQVGQLERAGSVIRSASPDDERSTLVTITAAGRDVVRRVLPGHVAVVRDLLLAPLSPADLGGLSDVLRRVRDSLRRRPPRSAARRSRQRAVDPTGPTGADAAVD